jgi:hypothetical protein
MSLDIFLQKFSAGQPTEVNREQVLAILNATKFTGPDNFGYYIVSFPDGVDVEFSAKGLDGRTKFNGCMFHIRGMNSQLVKFIFEIAKAGDMVILPATEDFVPILSIAGQRQHLPSDLAKNEPKPILCESSGELESLLSGGFGGWCKYRDQVVNKSR